MNVLGGHNPKPEPAQSIELVDGEHTYTWIFVDKNAKWFLRGAGGISIGKGMVKMVSVIEHLRIWFANENPATSEAAIAEADSASQAAVAEAAAEEDPMDQMDAFPNASPAVKPLKKKHLQLKVTTPILKPSLCQPDHQGSQTTLICRYMFTR